MQKIRILVIAPYEGLADAVSAIAHERQDVEITVEVGDLDKGKKLPWDLPTAIMILFFPVEVLRN